MKPFLIGCAILLAACGGSSLSVAPSPTPAPAPPPPLSLSGPWGGALAGSIDGVPFSRGVTVSVEHTGQHVTGTYAAGETGQRGSFAFDLTSLGLDAQIVNGVWNIDAPSTDAAVRCTGTAALADSTVRPFVLKALVVPLTNCDGAVTAVSLTMTR